MTSTTKVDLLYVATPQYGCVGWTITLSKCPSVEEKYYLQLLVTNTMDNTTPMASRIDFMGNQTSNSSMRPLTTSTIFNCGPHHKTFTLIRKRLRYKHAMIFQTHLMHPI